MSRGFNGMTLETFLEKGEPVKPLDIRPGDDKWKTLF